ncbi:MAG: gliding motility lipoprotein GldH [Bacteroidales bacterium]|jgi:gliding motility-associated lipoprotein GldH|nr:gliding motility lipoprotein GldH [Bacteroidales bacterium]
MNKVWIKRTMMIAALVLIATACNSDQIYKHITSFKDYRWQRLSEDKKSGNAIEFTDVEVKNNADPYDVLIGIRHSGVINVDKIQLLIDIVAPSGTKRSSVHTIKLKDRAGTKFIGDVMGDMYDIEERVKAYMSFTETGKYTIRITNMSSVFEIVGIIDMTLRIVKSDLDYNI